MLSWAAKHRWELCIVGVAIVARVAYFGVAFSAHDGNLLDTSRAADGYTSIAENILAGHGFSSAGGEPYVPNSFRMPLQPYFLASGHTIFGTWWGPLILTILIGSIIPLFGIFIAHYLGLPRRFALAAGFLLALEPVSVLLSILFYSETLFTLFLCASLLFLFVYFKDRRVRYVILSAVFLGLSMLTRPAVEYLPLFYMAIILWDARKIFSFRSLAHVALYGVVFVLILSPWLARNYYTFGVAALTPQEGVNLYANLVPSVLSVERGTSFDEEYQKLQAQGVSGPNATAVGADAGYTGKAIGILLEHPKGLVLTTLLIESTFFTHDGVLDMLRLAKVAPQERLGKPALTLLVSNPAVLWGYIGYFVTTPAVLVLVMRLVWWVVTVFFFVGAVAYLRHNGPTPASLAALCTIFYFALVTILVGLTVNSRYRVPVEFLIIPFALYGMYVSARWLRRKFSKIMLQPSGI